ncbi:hypothetical protein [Amaricoccus sp. W119]|uniref:hypothetical protein n=1 Tax=Amaricoccus sp. W119 TaxID=3391833 RepID=UPI0039A473A7
MISATWLGLRQPETLALERRRPFRLSLLAEGGKEIVTHRVVMRSLLTQSLIFGMLFSTLSSTQQVFDTTFGRAESFPLWFGGVALLSGLMGLVNAALVERVGMRRLVTTVLAIEIVLMALALALTLSGVLSPGLQFAVYLCWMGVIFGQMGLTVGNLNAMAMEPMGHLAGLTASITGSAATVLAVLLAVPAGLSFDGTPVPLMIGSLAMAILALLVVLPLRST